GDRPAARLAAAERAAPHPLQGGVDLAEELGLVPQQAERALFLAVVALGLLAHGARFGRLAVGLRPGRAEGRLAQVGHLGAEALRQVEELVAVGSEVGRSHGSLPERFGWSAITRCEGESQIGYHTRIRRLSAVVLVNFPGNGRSGTGPACQNRTACV